MAFADLRPRLGAGVLAVLCACAMPLPAVATAPAATREQVGAAVERLRADPHLPGTKTEKKLRFKDRGEDDDKEDEKSDDGSIAWLRDFAKAVAEGARWLVWGLGALALAWLLLRLRRWTQMRAAGGRPPGDTLPSHVGSLDIRPLSLPDDIGGAVAALWQRGQHRPALSLLYRGALSRLVHVHGVPVRAASTEGECVALAAARLPSGAQAFLVRLVDAWQLAAYGGRLPATGQVLAVCGEFDRHLGAGADAAAPAAGEVLPR